MFFALARRWEFWDGLAEAIVLRRYMLVLLEERNRVLEGKWRSRMSGGST